MDRAGHRRADTGPSDLVPALAGAKTLGWASWIVGPALFLVVITMLRPLRRVFGLFGLFGLFERIFLLTTNIWFALAAILVLSRLS